MKKFTSNISKKEFPANEIVNASSIRPAILKIIQKEFPGFYEHSSLSIKELNEYREKYISEVLQEEIGEISNLEESVIKNLKHKSNYQDKIDKEIANLSFGEKLSDKMASFGGSWTFIISFSVFIIFWIIINAFFLLNKGFDPYPFILLNLILSCIAAIQAPLIMMSQNRQETKDRQRAKEDYIVNLKSELEIRMLHEKIDHIMIHQQQSLLDIQELQIDMMKDILQGLNKG